MPDLITHTAAAYLVKKGFRITRFALLFYFGAILPDVVSRPLHILWPRTLWAAQALHSPAGVFLVCWLISLLFRVDQRKRVFGLIFAGCILHEFMDLLQKHLVGGYLWLFPFSLKTFSVGLFWPEDCIRFLPYTLLTILVVFTFSKLREAKKSKEK